jgi:hypothetical protein
MVVPRQPVDELITRISFPVALGFPERMLKDFQACAPDLDMRNTHSIPVRRIGFIEFEFLVKQ